MTWRDIVISEDWSPKIGGAHAWLESVYRFWPEPVAVYTAQPAKAQDMGDSSVAGADTLSVNRELIAVPEVNLRAKGLRDLLRNARIIRAKHSALPLRIHCKAYFPEGLIALFVKWTRKAPTRIIVYAHGEEINVSLTSRLYGLFARWVYRQADLVIANSANTLSMVKGVCTDARVKVVHPGVDYRHLRAQRSQRTEVRQALGLSDTDILVLSVGRLEPRKNFLAVYEAIKTLRAEGLDLNYVLAGSGEQRELIEHRREADRSEGWFLFKGPISETDKTRLFAAADLFVMPSIQAGPMIEGFGIVFLEAAAAGVPSISGRNGGQVEAVLHERTGINVDGTSVKDLTAAIRRLACDPGLRARFAQAGSEFAASQDWLEVSQRIRSLTEAIDPSDATGQ